MTDLERWYNNPAAHRASRIAGTPRARIDALTRQLSAPVETDPTKTAGYASRMGTVLDGLREDSTADAGKAGAMGLSPGAALAAGAGRRSQALVSGVRGATADAEATLAATRSQRMAMLMQALGMTASLDEREKERQAQKRKALLSMLGTLGGIGVSLIPGVGPIAGAAAIGAGAAGGSGLTTTHT